MKDSQLELNTQSKNFVTIKPFLSTLVDAVLFAKYASFTDEKKLKMLLSRASILHCSFAVEALANNLIQFINIGGHLSESIDKLDVVAKFELFSLILKKKKIERGVYCIQVFQDLIDIRNKYVHPKIVKSELVNNNGTLTSKKKKSLSQLKINDHRAKWSDVDANFCIVALLKSIDQFLLDEMEFEKKSLSCMFMDFLTIDGIHGPIVPSDVEWSDWAENFLKYRPKFYCDHVLVRFK